MGCAPSIDTQLIQKLSFDSKKILLIYKKPEEVHEIFTGNIYVQSPKSPIWNVIEYYNSHPTLHPLIELKEVSTVKTFVEDLQADSISDLFLYFTTLRPKYRAIYYICDGNNDWLTDGICFDRSSASPPTFILGAKPIFPCSDNKCKELLEYQSGTYYPGGSPMHFESYKIPVIKSYSEVALLSIILSDVAAGKYNFERTLGYANEEIRDYLTKSHFNNIEYLGELKRAISAAKRYADLGHDSSFIWLFGSISQDCNKLREPDDIVAFQNYLSKKYPNSDLMKNLSSQIDLRVSQLSSIEQERLLSAGYKDVRLTTNLVGSARDKVEKFLKSLNYEIKRRIARGNVVIFTPISLEVNEINSNIVQISLIGSFDKNKLKEDVESRRVSNQYNTPEDNEIFRNRFILTEQAFGYIKDLDFDNYLNLYTVIVGKPSSEMTVEFNALKYLIHDKVELTKDMIKDAIQGGYFVDFYKDILSLQVISNAHLVSKKNKEVVFDILHTDNYGGQQVHYLRHTTPRTTLTGRKSPEDTFLEYFSIK